ncbi:hypothetical protein AB1N83_011763 [Pleurotus pulmonarius]|nr:hypothetical protein EYR38_006291 [Pleurotus pulmonarius]
MSTLSYSAKLSAPAMTVRHFSSKGRYLQKFSNDPTTKLAQHCARTTTKLLRQSPLHNSQHAFLAPHTKLTPFIARLLRETNASPSTAHTALVIIAWLTKAGMCPLASSSPHHLFMGALRLAGSASAAAGRDGDAQWAADAGGVIPLDEVFLVRMELQAALRTFDDQQWAFVCNANGAADEISASHSETCKILHEAEHASHEGYAECKVHVRRRDTFRTNARLITSRAAAFLAGRIWI